MKRERAIEIARKHNIYYSTTGADTAIADAILEAVAEETKAIADQLDRSAAKLLEPKRTNEVDRHTAGVLAGAAEAIRARSGQ